MPKTTVDLPYRISYRAGVAHFNFLIETAKRRRRKESASEAARAIVDGVHESINRYPMKKAAPATDVHRGGPIPGLIKRRTNRTPKKK